ncbi:MAG: 23S rRNA (pseudouridine(1915)-N(3))-methyltransferase RlmH [Oscillospiraceae bacterium]|nr:23S rRNA (pseudouridine(1915)-N(3))-methyltransferase RlmH [Oscillospiraceae bacterium]
MLNINLICVGRMREAHYVSAFSEYEKRLRPYCKMELTELPETKLPQNPSQAEIVSGLRKEALEIEKNIPSSAFVIALCIEGSMLGSAEFASLMSKCAGEGKSKLCFIIGSSFGLDACIKKRADMCLSMSEMTFPHHLARVMLAEQIYRGIMISENSKYHK